LRTEIRIGDDSAVSVPGTHLGGVKHTSEVLLSPTAERADGQLRRAGKDARSAPSVGRVAERGPWTGQGRRRVERDPRAAAEVDVQVGGDGHTPGRVRIVGGDGDRRVGGTGSAAIL